MNKRVLGRSLPLRRPNLGDLYVFGLPAFRSLHHIELDCLTLLEGTESIGSDCRVMNEDIIAVGAADKPETLGVVKPFHCSLLHAYSFVA